MWFPDKRLSAALKELEGFWAKSHFISLTWANTTKKTCVKNVFFLLQIEGSLRCLNIEPDLAQREVAGGFWLLLMPRFLKLHTNNHKKQTQQNWSVFSGVRDFEQKPVYQPLSLRQTQRSTAVKRWCYSAFHSSSCLLQGFTKVWEKHCQRHNGPRV